MKKNGQQRKSKPVKKEKQPVVSDNKQKQSSASSWWSKAFGLRSMAVAIVLGLLLYQGVSTSASYQWVWNNLLKGNWTYIWANRKASLEERNQRKLGFDYIYLSHIKKNTPEDAIILFPLRTHITEQKGDQKLSNNVISKNWATHFLYPRTVLYKDEKDTNPLYGKVTHIAIVAGHGYEDVEYDVQQKYAFTVIPKTR
ncbi:MAG: hypothetical protein LBS43_02280 [Prevotellaceae bacterium]|jgi:hypothetical protein|nr:hypothetical protein [Prevotellaceae bacterium]